MRLPSCAFGFVLAAVASCATPRATPTTQPQQPPPLVDADPRAIGARFDADVGHVRVLVLASPS